MPPPEQTTTATPEAITTAPASVPAAVPTEQGRRAARNILWSGWGQISVAAAGIVWLFTVPRTLGPQYYGIFVLLSSLIDFHTMGCTLGVQNAFAYYFPLLRTHYPRQLSRLTTAYGLVVLGISLPAAFLVGWLGMRLGGNLVTALLAGLAALAALIQAANGIFGAILYGENRIATYSVRFPLQQVVTTAAVFAGAWWFGLKGSMAGLTAAVAVMLLWLLAVARPWRYFAAPADAVARLQDATAATDTTTNDPPPRLLRQALVFGLYSLFGGLAALTVTRGGNIILVGVGRTADEVAVFAVGLGFVLQGVVLLSALGTALTPGLASLISKGEPGRAADWAQRAARYQAFAAIVAVGFVAFLGKHLLYAAVGNRFPGVFTITMIGAAALVPMAQTNLSNQMAIAWGRPRITMEAWVLMSVLFLTGAAIYGSLDGPVGAALALVGTAWLTSFLVSWRLRSSGGPEMWNWPVLKLLLVAAPGFAATLLPDTILLNVLLYVGFIVYLALVAFMTNTITPAEIREIIGAIRHREP
ncbi:MAG: lipopolysaccharide biosynthesis protein [Armatimonadia bacterium]